MWLLFLLGELHLMIAELTGAVARRGYLGRSSSELSELLDRLVVEYGRAGYSGIEAAEVLGCSPNHIYRTFAGAEKQGRNLVIAPAALYRQALVTVTMALSSNDGVIVPDNCAARLIQISDIELSLLAAEMRAAACRDPGCPLAVSLARFLAGLEVAGDNEIPLNRVAATYGVMLSGQPWDTTHRSPLARVKVDLLGVQTPANKQRVHLRLCTVQAGRVLALGRNTWAVQQSDPRALPPSLDEFLPGIEKRLAVSG